MQAIKNAITNEPGTAIEKSTVEAGIKVYRYLLESKLSLISEPAVDIPDLPPCTKADLLANKDKVSFKNCSEVLYKRVALLVALARMTL